jgi:hypothetical protein
MAPSQVPDHAAADGIRIPVRIKLLQRANFVAERASFVLQLVKHVPAVFTVLAAGASALQVERDGGGRALAAAELVVGAWVLIVIAREAWHMFGRHTADALAHPSPDAAAQPKPSIDIPNLDAAALGFVESWHRTHVTGHFKLVSPQIVGATISLLMAFGGQRAIQKRAPRVRFYIAVTPAGIQYKAGPRTSWRADWTDVAAVERTQDEIAVRLQSGRRRVLRADYFFDGEALLVETSAAIAAYAPTHLAGAVAGATASAPRPHGGDGALRLS